VRFKLIAALTTLDKRTTHYKR